MTKIKWLSMNLIAVACLTGFLKESPVDEMSSYLADIKVSVRSNPKLDLGELPQEQPYMPVHYRGNTNPFDLRGFVRPKEAEGSAGVAVAKDEICEGVDPTLRTPDFLQSYELSSLNMVGSIGRPSSTDGRHSGEAQGNFKALIRTPDKGVILTESGNHVGTNYGHIDQVTFSRLSMTEKYKVRGCWQDKPNSMQVN